MSESVLVYGAGGHAKVVIDLLEQSGRYVVRCVVADDVAAAGRVLLGRHPVVGRETGLAQRAQVSAAIVAIGNNAGRRRVFEWLADTGFSFATGVHSHAVLARDVLLGEGTVVMAGTILNSDTRVGRNCILNTGARVDHDCLVGDHVHIAPGAVLCGSVSVGAESFVGAGAVIVPGIKVGARVTIGAGSTVLSDVADDATVAGSPARPVSAANPAREMRST